MNSRGILWADREGGGQIHASDNLSLVSLHRPRFERSLRVSPRAGPPSPIARVCLGGSGRRTRPRNDAAQFAGGNCAYYDQNKTIKTYVVDRSFWGLVADELCTADRTARMDL
jgi:hypothetical protein